LFVFPVPGDYHCPEPQTARPADATENDNETSDEMIRPGHARPGTSETTDMTPSDEEIAEIRAQLNELQIEHRDLDLVIEHLALNPPPDQLLVRRLKKRKLQLKDRITLLERMLVPDIPA